MFSSVLSVRGGSRLRLAAVLSILGLLPAGALHAATGTWIGANGATWDTTAANWSGVTGSPWASSGNNAEFTSAGSATISGPVYASQVNYTAGSGTFTVNGNGLDLSVGSTVSGGGTLELTGNLIGGALTKNGDGVMRLSSANGYTGATTVNQGTLDLAFSGGLNSGTGTIAVGSNITVNAGGTLLGSDFNALGFQAVHANDQLTINEGGQLRVGAGTVLSMPYALNVVGGTISSVDGGFPTFGTIFYGSTEGTFTSSSGSAAATISAQNFNLQGAAFNVVRGGGPVDLNVTSALIGNALTKNGNGVMRLSSANNYAGATIVNQGTLDLAFSGNDNSGVGTIAVGSNITVNSGGTLLGSVGNALGYGFVHTVGGTTDQLTINEGGQLRVGAGTVLSMPYALNVVGGTISSVDGGFPTLGTIFYQSTEGTFTSSIGGAAATISAQYFSLRGASFNVVRGGGPVDLDVTGNLTGPEALTKNGNGVMRLSSANDYTGATIVNDGTLDLAFSGDSNFGVGTIAVGSNITVNAGGTLLGSTKNALGYGFVHTVGGTTDQLTINEGGQLRVGAGTVLSMPYALNVVGGTISSVDGGNPNFGTIFYGSTEGTFTSSSGSAAATISAQNFNLQGASFNVVRGSGPVDLDVTGNLTGPEALTKNGNGVMRLSSANDYTGPTTVSAGVLSLTHANALGASGTDSATTVANGAQIALSGNISVSEPITLNGFGAVRNAADGGALRNLSGDNTITGLLSIGATGADNGAWIRGTAGNLTVAGGISASNRDLTLTGPGGISITTTAMNLGAGGSFVTFDNGTPVSLAVAGNTAGQVTVYYGGKLRTDAVNAFSSSTGLFMGSVDNSDGTLDLGGNNQQFGNLQSYGSGSVIITSTAAATLAINQTTNLSYLGQITGAITLAKTGGSTLTLSGNNTYTGNTDISAGALALGSGGSIANSGVINVASGATFDVSAVSGGFVLASGQTLKGAGTVSGATTINGNLAPGNSPGTLSFANGLSLGSTSTSTFEIAGIGAGQFDRVIVTGLLNFGGTLALNNTGYTAVYGDSVDLFDWTTTTGSFSSITGTDLGGGLSWDTSSLYSNGVIMVVPEPSTYALLAAGGVGSLLMFRRRRA
jgi:autotransporter-associated beta strand protein